MAVGYWYDDAANRESLLDMIENISPKETQLLSDTDEFTNFSSL